MALLVIGKYAEAQINYFESFNGCSNATCNNWTISGGISPSITSSASLGYSPCNTSSAKSNIWSSNPTSTLVSGIIATGNGLPLTLSIAAKAINYSDGAATTAGHGTFTASWSTDGISWTTLNTHNNISSTSCNTYTFNEFTPSIGQNIYLRIVSTRTDGDFYTVIDDINLTDCSPTATFTKTCKTDLSYDLDVNIINLKSATSVRVFDGTSNLETGINTIGTKSYTSLSGTKTYSVIDESNASCKKDTSITACTNCDVLSVTFGTKSDCKSNLTYDVPVTINVLAPGQTIKIKKGTTDLLVNISSVGTYIVQNLSDVSILTVEDESDATCTKVSSSYAACNICDLTTRPTDECVNAPLIDLSQSFYGSTNCSYTASAGSPDVCGMSIENDSWIKFIAGATEVEIEFTVGTCSGGNNGIQLAVFSGACGGLSLVPGSCENPSSTNNSESTNTWNFSGLTIGNEYHIRIDGYAGQLCDYYFTPISGVVITPPNDSCINASILLCGERDTASNILSTLSDAPSSCGGLSPGKGNWYLFAGTGDSVTVSTDNALTNFNTEIFVYSGSCGTLTCIGSDNDSGTGSTSTYKFKSLVGTNYYIYVDGNGVSEGQYEVSLNCISLPSCNANAGSWN